MQALRDQLTPFSLLLPVKRPARKSDSLVGLVLNHTPYVQRHRCSAQQSGVAFTRSPVRCKFAPKARVFLLSVLFKLAELGVRARSASVGHSLFLVASVAAWSSTRFAPKSDGFPLFTSPDFAAPSPPRTEGSDDWCKLLRSCFTMTPVHGCVVRDLTSRSLFASAPRPREVWRLLVAPSSRGMV